MKNGPGGTPSSNSKNIWWKEAGRAEQDFKEVRTRVLAEIDDAVEWGLKQPYPDPSTLEQNVYEKI